MRRASAFLVALITFWLAASAPAHAGPLLTAVGALVVNLGAVGNAIVGLVVNFGFQTLMTAFFGPKEPKDKGTKQRMENGADKAPKIILGQYGTPGHLLYHNSFLENRKVYVQVIILSAIPVKGVSNYCRIAGQNCTIDFGTVDDDGFSPVSEYQQYGNNYAKVKIHLGGQTTADPFLVDNFGSDPDFPWAADMIVKGCAYVIVQSLYSKKGVWAGTPEYFFKVDGVPLYDPRRDSSVGGSGSQRWNDMSTWGGPGDYNPKVQIYNIIRGIRDIDGSRLWGGRAEAYRLPLDYWFAAMNVCDQDIEKKNGDIVKRYQTGLEIELDSEPLDIIMDLDKSCSGFTTEYGGKYKTWCGEPGLSVMTITDDDFYISDPMKDDPFKPVQETYNSAVATYPEPRSGWSMEPGPLYVDDEYLAADDNEPLVLDAQLPYVTENNQVQRLMREAIRESRIQLSHTGTLPPEAYILEPHDRISYISARNGYHGDGVDFLIGSKEDYPDVRQVVTIRGVNPNAFGWLKEMELDHTVGRMGIVRHNALDVAFSVAPDWTETENGKDKPAIAVTWDWGDIDVDVDRVKWEVRKASTGKKIAEGAIHKLEDGHALLVHPAFRFKQQLEIHFYAQPISRRDSDWTVWLPITLIDLSKPDAPALEAQSFLAGDGTLDYYLKIDWASVSGEIEYRVEVTEITDGNAVRVHPAPTSHLKLRVSSGGQFSVRIATKAADGGTQSDWSNPTTITISPKALNDDPPTDLTATGAFGKIILGLKHAASQKDFNHFNIYEANVNDFTDPSLKLIDDTPASSYSRNGLATGAQRWYWATTVDRHGNESAKFPASNTNGRTAVSTPIGNSDTDPNSPNAPAAPTLTTYTAELTGDNTVDTGLLVTLTEPAIDTAHPAAVDYVVEIWRSSTLNGTYSFWKPLRSKELSIPFACSTKWFYKAKARGISKFGNVGALSSLTAVGVQPLQYSAAVQAATGLQVSPVPKGFFLKAPKGTDPNYKATIFFADGVEIERRHGNTFTDTSVRTIGDSVTYTFQYMDTQNRVGTVSGGVTVTYRGVQSGDIAAGAVDNAALASGAVSNAKLANNAVDSNKILDGAVVGSKILDGVLSATKFASAVKPVEVFSALPSTGNVDGRMVFLTTDKKLYRYDAGAGAFTAAVPAADISGTLTDAQLAAISAAKITGQVVAAQIADAAISVAKFAAGLKPVEVLAALPSTGNTAGRMVFLTTDNKLYRYNGAGFVSTVPSTDLTGTLTDAQLSAISAAKITGQVVAAQIADAAITTAKFAAGLTPVEIMAALPSSGNFQGRMVLLTSDNKLYRYNGSAFVASVPAADLTGTLTDAQLAAISAAKITGQVVAAQIADAAITTAKFAAGLTPVEVVGTLPASGNFAGRMCFLTTDSKLYRYNGTAFVASVATTDLTGTLADAQLAAISASKVTGQLTDAQLAAISAAKLTGTITTTQITDDAITTAKIAAGAVTATEIAAGAIIAGKIAAGIITATEIAAATITGAKIAAGTIAAGNIAAGTITGDRLAANTITAAQIAADTITAGQIAAGAISSSELAANAVIAGKIAAGVITATEIAAATITGAKIAADAITAAHILAGTITSAEIAANTITGGNIAAGTITAAQIAADTITAGQIAAGAISSSELAAGAVIAGKIAAGIITATEIAAATITGAKIAADTITAANILAATITSAEIAANTITGSNIAASTITAANIAADTITAGQIAAGAISTSELAAGAIVASKIAVGTFSDNLVLDGDFESTLIDMWSGGGGTLTNIADTSAPGGGRALKFDRGVTDNTVSMNRIWANYIAVEAGDTYYAEFTIKGSTASAAGAYLRILFYDANKAAINDPASGLPYRDFYTNGAITTAYATQKNSYVIPAGVKYVRVQIYHHSTSTAQSLFVSNVMLKRLITGDLIVTGSITAANIQAGTITSNEIAAATIVGGKIAANTITGGNIAAGTITAANIAADTITAGQIAAGAISSSELAAGAVIAGKIAAGIITATELAAGAVTAAKINVTSLAAISATLGNVDISNANIGTLTVGTINIANGAVTDAKGDQTAPGTPGTPTPVSITADIDKDGTLDTGLTVTWTAPASGRAPKRYRIEIWRRKGDKGTDGNNVTGYTFWKNEFSNQLSHTFKANAQYFHKVRIFGITGNDVEGAGSAYTTVGVAPDGKASFIPDNPTHNLNVLVTNAPIGKIIQWAEITNPDYDHTDIYIKSTSAYPPTTCFGTLGKAGGLIQYPGAGFGDIYYVWVQHVDRSGNKSDFCGASGLGSVGATAIEAGIGTNNMQTASVTSAILDVSAVSNKMAAAAVGSVGSYAFLKNTTASALTPGDTTSGSNLVYSDTSLTSGSNPSGTWRCMGRAPAGQATLFLRIS